MKLKRVSSLIAIFLICFAISNCGNKQEKKSNIKISDEQIKKTKGGSSKLEKWKILADIVFSDIDGTSAIVLPDGKIRCYFTENGYIGYSESIDGNSFGENCRTNIDFNNSQTGGEVPRNPAVLRLKSGRYMMLFNTGDAVGENVENGSNDKLNLAYSDDGKNFELLGVVADTTRDKNAVASEVDSLILPDGSIRIYGSQKGICTAVSKDGGKTWIADGIELIEEGASDPDVHIRDDGIYVMYYEITEENKSSIKMALSKDGLIWDLVDGYIVSDKDDVLSSPDYLSIREKKEILYFTQRKESIDKVSSSVRIAIKQ